ncbi:VOC family protein [Polyangium jinanense]|nr:VOC family protein [Polyangium jinanense]
MRHDIVRIHHVGHVVDDMAAALALYRRLGFVVPPPSYPAMARQEGAEPEPFGAANTHADFPGNFLELATRVREGDHIPADAKLVPLQAPADVLPKLVERIATTSASLAVCLERFEGLHILMFSSPDIDAVATRLTASGIGHGGVNTVRRPVETETGTVVETVRYLEIDTRPGSVAEGRVGVAAELDSHIQGARQSDHPNGAVDLVEAVLCVADSELAAAQARYQDYLDRPIRTDGPAQVFDLDNARLTLVPESGLATLLPGEQPAALPALVAYTVAVRDIAATQNLLRDNGIPLRRTASGDPFVPSANALGTAIIFREALPPEHATVRGTWPK